MIGRLSIAVHASMLRRRLATETTEKACERLANMIKESGFEVTRARLTRARSGPAIHLVATAC